MRRAWLLLPASFALTACGLLAGLEDVPVPDDAADGAHGADGRSSGRDDVGVDSGLTHADAKTDGGHDATKVPDAKLDTGHDAKIDAKTDTGHDAKTDTGHDAKSPGHDTGPMDDASDAIAPLQAGYIYCGVTGASCNAAGGQECCLTLYGELVDSGAIFQNLDTSCEVAGGPNCGFSTQESENFSVAFPQTCSTAADCAAGEVCCVSTSGGEPPGINGISCVAAGACTSPDTLCSGNAGCLNVCVLETDPVLSHVWPKHCSGSP
jgi:hypothetical protein